MSAPRLTLEPLMSWLYGSHARGDADESSDVDILTVGAPAPRWVFDELRVSPNDKKVAISVYSVAEFERMVAYGSLFLQHIRAEGRYLGGENDCSLRETLGAMGPYQRASRDVKSFRQSIWEAVESVTSCDGSLLYEASVLATIARHCSILGCYVVGQPRFGRVEPVSLFGDIVGLAQYEISVLCKAAAYRLAAARQRPAPSPTVTEFTHLAELTIRLVEALEENVRAYEQRLSSAA